MGRDKLNSTRNIGITVLGIMYVPVLLGSVIALRNLDTVYSTYFTISMVLAIWIAHRLEVDSNTALSRRSWNQSWFHKTFGIIWGQKASSDRHEKYFQNIRESHWHLMKIDRKITPNRPQIVPKSSRNFAVGSNFRSLNKWPAALYIYIISISMYDFVSDVH